MVALEEELSEAMGLLQEQAEHVDAKDAEIGQMASEMAGMAEAARALEDKEAEIARLLGDAAEAQAALTRRDEAAADAHVAALASMEEQLAAAQAERAALVAEAVRKDEAITAAIEAAAATEDALRVERQAADRLWRDSQGNAVALGLRARWRKGESGPVPAERFLRRVVRGLFAA